METTINKQEESNTFQMIFMNTLELQIETEKTFNFVSEYFKKNFRDNFDKYIVPLKSLLTTIEQNRKAILHSKN